MNQYAFDFALHYYQPRFPEDCARIVHVAKAHGIGCTEKQAERIWQWYSDVRSAQWLGVQNKDEAEIWEAICEFVKHKWESIDPEFFDHRSRAILP